MKLIKIYFDAFKSLLNNELEISQDCIGFVGPNESGKSNVLLAVNILSNEKQLSIQDTPKMDKSKNPSLRFLFKLSDNEIAEIDKKIIEWQEKNTIYKKKINLHNTLLYNITYDKKENKELRFFSFEDIKIEPDFLFLKFNKIEESECKLLIQDDYVSITSALIVNKKDIEKDLTEKYTLELQTLTSEIINLDNQLNEINNSIKEEQPNTNENNEGDNGNVSSNNPSNNEISSLREKIDALNKRKVDLESKISGYNTLELIGEQITIIQDCTNNISAKQTEKSTTTKKITELEKVNPLTDVQKKELSTLKTNLSKITKELEELNEEKDFAEATLEILKEPISEKYTSDKNELNKHLISVIDSYLNSILPKVVFWEHNNKYILKSETLFSGILDKSDVNEVSRPLVNIFLLGLRTKTFGEIKNKIKEIQSDSNERSRLNSTLNTKINEYIKKVWGDYDQKILITLEKDQIRVEFYDPKKEDASYYNMEERSQGCRSFLSFLLTIGAEAKHGIIKNTILLLDEPETHLHPSGARYMLEELIKISENDNLVLYATHSIFLIDKKNLNRHIILKKDKEKTIIQPANVGRVGYLMQEEVLYQALDVNINTEFTSSKEYNFVFEGDGDVRIFEHYYEKILKENNRPYALNSTKLFQGGKCDDIKKYFISKNINLTSKWVFILDKDLPANKLKSFLEGKYKEYLKKDIYIFQYSKKQLGENETELEDLLPKELIVDSYVDSFKFFNIEQSKDKINQIVSNSLSYAEYDTTVVELVESKLVSDFKGKFKEILNQSIKDLLQKVKNEQNFKDSFPEYYEWIIQVMQVINGKQEVNVPKVSKENAEKKPISTTKGIIVKK